jgi:predicted MPP superfamily phosphohydrolase
MSTVLGVLLFLVPLLAIVFGVHALLAWTIARAFAVTAAGAKLWLFLGPLGLTLGLVFSYLLLHVHRNPITVGYVWLSSVWLGLFVNLALALAGTWLVFGLTRLVGLAVDLRWVCLAAGGLAVAGLVVGLWNAREPGLVRLDVTLDGLPPAWRGRTLVQLSDLHVGTLRGESYLQGVVDRVNALDPDLVVLTGDLFDGAAGGLERFVAPLSALRARHGVFFVTGNHEGYLGLDEPLRVLAKTPVRVLDHDVVDVEDLQIVGVPFPEHDRPSSPEALDALARRIDRGRASVLLYHTPTDVGALFANRGAQQNRTYLAPDTSFRFAREAGIDLQLSGHTHQGQFLPFTWLTRALFHGFDYGLNRSGELQVYTTSGTGTWGPPVRTGSRSEIAVITLR